MLTRDLHREDDGVTLIELLIVIVILGVVGGIVTTTVVRSIVVTTKATERAESLATLQNTIQRIGREIRAADPLLVDETKDVSRYIGAEVYRSGERHVVVYRVDGNGDLVEDRTIYDVATGTEKSSVTGRLLANDVQTVQFEYFDDIFEDADSDDIDDPISCDYTTSVGCLDTYREAQYVRIAVTTDLTNQPDQEIDTLVTLRNPRG